MAVHATSLSTLFMIHWMNRKKKVNETGNLVLALAALHQ